ncbi:MAG TPA: hypothetical protein VH475_10880 [Tepidisphaeraceae bacterium]|jgi:hypothetical protein
MTHDPNDQLTSRLRAQADAFRPELPAALHRQIASALAAARQDDPARPTSWLWSFTAVATLAVVIFAATLIVRSHTHHTPIAQYPGRDRNPALVVTRNADLASAANPLRLGHYLERPLESEVENLLTDLSRTRQTLTRVLPATPAAKPQKVGGSPAGA